MKIKGISILVLLAALSGCQESNPAAITPIYSGDSLELTIVATTSRTTKTVLSGRKVLWTEGDRLSVAYHPAGQEDWKLAQTETAGISETQATFKTTLSPVPAYQSVAYAYFPANELSPREELLRLTVADEQFPSGDSFDGNSDILLSQQFIPAGNVATTFSHMGTILRLSISNADLSREKIWSLTMQAAVPVAGDVLIDPAQAAPVEIENPSNTLTATFPEDKRFVLGDSGQYIYLVACPQTLSKGSTLLFTGETDNYIFTREVNLENDIVLQAGHLAPITVVVQEITRK